MNLLVRRVPGHVHSVLVQRAKRNKRSLNGEVLAILEAAVLEDEEGVEERLELFKGLRAEVGEGLSPEEIRAAIEEGRA